MCLGYAAAPQRLHFHRLLSSGGTNKAFVDEVSAVRAETVLAALAAVLSALVSVYLIGFLISVFVYYPLEVGAQKVVHQLQDNCAAYGNIVFSLRNAYGNIIKTMFLKGLFMRLWGLLFVISGIVKSYEYRMIPYLLAENPQMSSKEVFSRSREMMRGYKWNAFVLYWLFLGWHILGLRTFGIVEVFYSLPYCYRTNA